MIPSFLKKGEAGKLAWIIWWAGLSAFAATIADREVADLEHRVAARAAFVAGLETHDKELVARTLTAASNQHDAYLAAARTVKARLDALPDSRATSWLVTLVHDLSRTHGCTVTGVDVTLRAAEPKECGLTWVQVSAHLAGPYPALRGWLNGLAASAPGRPTGGLPIRQLTLNRGGDAGANAVQADCQFEVLAR